MQMRNSVGRGNGGGTRIRLSPEGTVWPCDHLHDDMMRLVVAERPNVHVQTSQAARRAPIESAHESERRIYAAYARSYLTKKPAKTLSNINGHVFSAIERAGGVIEWINASEIRLKRFWETVEKQRSSILT